MLTQILPTSSRPDAPHVFLQARRPERSGQSMSAVALLATVSLLGACAAGPGPATVAATGGSGVETVRELRHFGPQGKSAPVFVTREVRTRGPAGVGAESFVRDR